MHTKKIVCFLIFHSILFHSRVVSERFDVSKSTAWLNVNKVCTVLAKLSGNYIRWPSGNKVKETMAKFKRRQGFMNVIGAIDGSHIPICAPAKQQAAYCNRKGYHSVVLQAVCDADYYFTDVFAGNKYIRVNN